jgi:hypothetical protein
MRSRDLLYHGRASPGGTSGRSAGAGSGLGWRASASAPNAAARWDRTFFCSMESSAMVRPMAGNQKWGS